MAETLRIYLAGPIEAHCWRHRLVPDLRNAVGVGEDYEELGSRVLGLGQHEYVGPFFIGCDHSCGHGPTLHGGATDAPSDGYPGGCISTGDGGFTREQVRRFCRAQIDSADLVFAWINRAQAYGTMWELGYAAAKRKHIAVRWPREFDISEMWLCLPQDARPAVDVVDSFNEVVRARISVVATTPIERMLRNELLAAFYGMQFTLRGQHPIGAYHVDFAVWCEGNPWRVAIECDGHDFHEKTKEQVARDKMRDRDLVFEGWTVLRFSGHEIYKDPRACANTIQQHCLKLEAAR